MSKTSTSRTIAAARREMMLPADVVNLNAGTCSPVPQPVFDALTAHMQKQSEDPADYIWTGVIPYIEDGRKRLAAFLGADTDSLMLCTNASWAVNTVLQTFAWKAGDELLMSDQEYHHYMPLFSLLEKKFQVSVKKVALPLATSHERLSDEDLCRMVTEQFTGKTRMLFFSHITSPTGTRLPASTICAAARARGITTFVDGAHAPGHVAVDLGSMRPDFYAANTHKWMMNPAGCAFLYAAPDVRFAFTPLMLMGGYESVLRRENRPTPYGCTAWQFAHEYQGTRNLAPFAVLANTIAFYDSIGMEEIIRTWKENTLHARALLEEAGLTIVTPTGNEPQSCMTACLIPVGPGQRGERGGRIDAAAARAWFRKTHNLELAFPTLGDGTCLFRISSAWFNTKEQLEALVQLLRGFDWSRFQF